MIGKKLQLLLLFLFTISFVTGGFSYFYLFAPFKPKREVTLQISPGTALGQVAEHLARQEVLRSSLALKLIARWYEAGNRIQSGEYRFSEAATPRQVLHRLVSGDVVKVSLTIPEGFNRSEERR